MEEGEALGYQMGAAYVVNERMSDLNVMISVSLCWPHVVPERAFRIFNRWVDRVMSVWMCGVNVRWVSKVIPRIRGVRLRGSGVSCSVT